MAFYFFFESEETFILWFGIFINRDCYTSQGIFGSLAIADCLNKQRFQYQLSNRAVNISARLLPRFTEDFHFQKFKMFIIVAFAHY